MKGNARKGLPRLRPGCRKEAVVDFEHENREAGAIVLSEDISAREGSEFSWFERAIWTLVVEDLVAEFFVVTLPGITAEIDHTLGSVVMAVEIGISGIPGKLGIVVDELTGASGFLGG